MESIRIGILLLSHYNLCLFGEKYKKKLKKHFDHSLSKCFFNGNKLLTSSSALFPQIPSYFLIIGPVLNSYEHVDK